jgi:hypothetical protein
MAFKLAAVNSYRDALHPTFASVIVARFLLMRTRKRWGRGEGAAFGAHPLDSP